MLHVYTCKILDQTHYEIKILQVQNSTTDVGAKDAEIKRGRIFTCIQYSSKKGDNPFQERHCVIKFNTSCREPLAQF